MSGVRATLGDVAFATAWARGKVMDWQQVVAHVLGETEVGTDSLVAKA